MTAVTERNRAAAPATVRVATTFGVRVAGLPATALDRIVDPALRDAVVALADEAAELETLATSLSDRCYEVIAHLPDPDAKPKLVALRRKVHQLRDPARLLADPLVAGALDAGLAGAIAAFGVRAVGLRDARAGLPAVFAGAEQRVGAQLRDIAGDAGFDRGLAHASPTLREVLRRKPGRQELIRLAVYIARAAGKTSPFTTFTASGLGRFVPSGPALRWMADEPARSVVELDLAAVAQLVPPPADPIVEVNPSARVAGDAVEFLGAPPDEHLLTLPLTAPLRHTLRAAAAGAPFSTLVGAVPAEPAKVVAYLRSLLTNGLLRVRPEFDAHAADLLAELGETATRDLLEEYGQARGDARAVLGRQLHEHLGARGVTGDVRDVVSEHSVIAGTVVEAGLPAWQGVLDDLALACRVLAVFDCTLPFTLALGAFVREHFGGEPVPFAPFYAELLRSGDEVRRLHPAAVAWDLTGLTGTLAASPVPEVRELVEVIASVRAALHDRDLLTRALDSAPAWIRWPTSVAVYAQRDGERLIVNAVNSGFGKARAHVHRLLRRLPGDPLDVDTVDPDDAGYAEFTDTLGTSLNQRDLTLARRLDYLPSARLRVGVDAEGLPVLLDGDETVRPVHGGLSYERQFPPVLALLVEGFGENPILLRPDQPIQHDAAAGSGSGRVLHAPRLGIGDVVLRRATWVAHSGTLPVRVPGASDAEFLLALTGWLREHGIPLQFYVSVLRIDAETVGGLADDRSRKPLFVDVGAPHLVLAFERSIRDEGCAAVFSEVAPSPSAAVVDGDGVPRVTEYVIELSCRGGSA